MAELKEINILQRQIEKLQADFMEQQAKCATMHVSMDGMKRQLKDLYLQQDAVYKSIVGERTV